MSLYLMIRNLGVADYRALTLLGVSTSRHSTRNGTIGTFGSGGKLSLALLLREGLWPIIYTGNLRMEFFVKPQNVGGVNFDRICVKYSGKDIDGSTKNSTEDLGITTAWGEKDWSRLSYAFREFVSNGIDGQIASGAPFSELEFEITANPRARSGYTSVYIPYDSRIKQIYEQKDMMFLHFSDPLLLLEKMIPKRRPQEDKVYIYKKGVLVNYDKGKSLFDYNLGDELVLDESRNCSTYDTRYSVSKAIAKAGPDKIARILQYVINGDDIWEGKLDVDYLASAYEDEQEKLVRAGNWKKAFNSIAGDRGVVVSGLLGTSDSVSRKGFSPVVIKEPAWLQTLERYGVQSQFTVLTSNEREGKEIGEPTQDMLNATEFVWNLLEKYQLTNGKTTPKVKSFVKITDAGSITFGYYELGGDTIFINKDIGVGKSKLLYQTVLEEIGHYTTQSSDNSRDFQEFFIKIIIEMCDI